MTRSQVVAVRVLLVCLAVGVGFYVLQGPVRTMEAKLAVATLRLFGVDNVVGSRPTTLLVMPSGGAAFHVLITPSCSSIASLVAFGCLAPLVPVRSVLSRALAFGSATLVIAASNIVRITASIGIGLWAGRTSLVLFHDWVGSMFTVLYTLGGYMLVLTFLLPKTGRVDVGAIRRRALEPIAHAG